MEQTIGAFGREPAGGLIVMPEIFTTVHHKRIVALADQYHLPTVYAFRFFATSGGLIGAPARIASATSSRTVSAASCSIQSEVRL
jgi:hypothetical protein